MGSIPGQRYNHAIGLYFYNARYDDPALGRFIQPDTIVPNPGDPQSLNRYSYVGNNPLVYTDPDGHCAPLCTSIVGAVVGGVIGAGSVALPQMIHNVREGQPLTANIDPTEVGKAAAVGAVSGAVAGATFGLGTAVLGSGLAGTAASGALSGVMGGRASVLTESTWDEYIKWKQGQPAEIQNIVSNAMTNGLLDPRQVAVDAVSGAISVGIGKAGISVLGKAGLVVFEQSEIVDPPMIKFYPNGKVYLEYGKRIYLPQDTIDKLLTAIAVGNTEIVQEILTQLSFKTTEEAIDDD